MCGRFVGFSAIEQIQLRFDIDEIRMDQVKPNYNVTPRQQIAVIFQEGSQRILETMHWGLVPFWAKDPSIGNRMINARSETVAEKPAFRVAFKKRRCLIVNDGFYEWKGPKNNRQPVFIKPREQRGPFAFAGLWESWRPKNDKNDAPYKSCTILTTAASESIAPIHHRMAVVLKPQVFGRWLDPLQEDPAALKRMLSENSYREFENHPVSKEVNSPGNNHPSLIEAR